MLVNSEPIVDFYVSFGFALGRCAESFDPGSTAKAVWRYPPPTETETAEDRSPPSDDERRESALPRSAKRRTAGSLNRSNGLLGLFSVWMSARAIASER